jgi:hypothetical protein
MPVERLAPIDDLARFPAGFRHLIVHKLRIDGRHAPDDRLDGPPLLRVVREFVWRVAVGQRRRRRANEHCGYEK